MVCIHALRVGEENTATGFLPRSFLILKLRRHHGDRNTPARLPPEWQLAERNNSKSLAPCLPLQPCRLSPLRNERSGNDWIGQGLGFLVYSNLQDQIRGDAFILRNKIAGQNTANSKSGRKIGFAIISIRNIRFKACPGVWRYAEIIEITFWENWAL